MGTLGVIYRSKGLLQTARSGMRISYETARRDAGDAPRIVKDPYPHGHDKEARSACQTRCVLACAAARENGHPLLSGERHWASAPK